MQYGGRDVFMVMIQVVGLFCFGVMSTASAFRGVRVDGYSSASSVESSLLFSPVDPGVVRVLSGLLLVSTALGFLAGLVPCLILKSRESFFVDRPSSSKSGCLHLRCQKSRHRRGMSQSLFLPGRPVVITLQ